MSAASSGVMVSCGAETESAVRSFFLLLGSGLLEGLLLLVLLVPLVVSLVGEGSFHFLETGLDDSTDLDLSVRCL